MTNVLLINTTYFGSTDIGGNRAHKTIKKSLRDLLKENLKIITFSFQNHIEADTDVTINIKNTYDIIPHLYHINKLTKPNDIVIIDGCLAHLCYLCAKLMYNLQNRTITINHNNEFDLHGIVKGSIYGFSQYLNTKKSLFNLWFTDRDKSKFPSAKNSITCIPLSLNEYINITETVESSKTSSIDKNFVFDKEFNYAAIPSNLSYTENIKGLKIFYREYRKKVIGKNIFISTPNKDFIDTDLTNTIESFGDKIVSFPTINEYYKFIINSDCIILPIFSGSGLQIKALDALLSGRPVFASKFIIKSNDSFSCFNPIDNINTINIDNNGAKCDSLEESKKILNQLIDITLHKFLHDYGILEN